MAKEIAAIYKGKIPINIYNILINYGSNNINRLQIYIKFKHQYDKLCIQLGKDYITQCEYDKYSSTLSRPYLRKILKESYSKTLKNSGCSMSKKADFNIKENTENIDEKILRLRLNGYTYNKISESLNISIHAIKIRLDKIYYNSTEHIKSKLDHIKKYNILLSYKKNGRKHKFSHSRSI